MATDGPDPPPCDPDVFRDGVCVGIFATAGACAFERLIVRVREASSQPVDWHYAGGRARVLTTGDAGLVRKCLAEIVIPSVPAGYTC